MKFESLLSGQEVGGPPAAVEDRGESGGELLFDSRRENSRTIPVL